MSSKFFFTAVVLLLITTHSLQAKIWTVSQRPGANFTTLVAAVGSASVVSGDTVLVSGSSAAYASASLSKRLTIIGPGFFLNENTGLQADTNSAKIAGFTFNAASAGSVIMGLHFTSEVTINADNITVSRCRLESTSNYVDLMSISVRDSIVIQQCYFRSTSTFAYRGIYISTGATQIFIRNNYLEDLSTSYDAIGCGGAVTGDFSNNTITGSVTVNGSVNFNNNILRSTTACTFTGVTPFNNISAGTQMQPWAGQGSGVGNQYNISMSTVFTGTGSRDGQWQILAAGPADNKGFGGAGQDCGMFDTYDGRAYVLSGIPPTPAIYLFNTVVGGSTITIDVNVKSNN